MNQKRFLVAVLLFVAGAFGSVNAQTIPCQPGSLSFPYVRGSISLSYQICFSPSLYWDGTMTYNNVSFDGSFSINGSMNIRLNFAGSAIGSVVLSGGPLTYTVSGQQYTVLFNNLSYGLSSVPVSVSGSLTVNGVNYPGSMQHLAFVFR